MTNKDKVNIALENASEDKIKEVLDFLGYKEDGKFVPKENEQYWTITSIGKVDYYRWGGDRFDNYQLSIGNVYETKEDAEKALDFQTRKAKLLKEIEDSSDVIDWEDDDQLKHLLYYSVNFNGIRTFTNRRCKYQGITYTTNRQFLEKLITTRSEELKELLFNIKGD